MASNSVVQDTLKLSAEVESIVGATSVLDTHTHLYDPAFGPLLLWGIDDLPVYHYLIAEGFRHFDIPYSKFWTLRKTQLIWDALFIQNSPISEARRGVLTTLNALGLGPDGDLQRQSSRMACMACHDSDIAKIHGNLMTYIPDSGDPYGPSAVETCVICYGPNAEFPPDKVHSITKPCVPPYPRAPREP